MKNEHHIFVCIIGGEMVHLSLSGRARRKKKKLVGFLREISRLLIAYR